MWSNDFLAIWGFKGKVDLPLGRISRQWLSRTPSRVLASGVPARASASLCRRVLPHGQLGRPRAWRSLFPLFQVATLGALVGWLRRRGARRGRRSLAAAIVALFAAALLGLPDGPGRSAPRLRPAPLRHGARRRSRREHAGALRRLALAAALIAATKNEGLFLAAAGCAVGLAFGGTRRWKIAAAALPTALLVHSSSSAVARTAAAARLRPLGLFSAGRLVEALSTAARAGRRRLGGPAAGGGARRLGRGAGLRAPSAGRGRGRRVSPAAGVRRARSGVAGPHVAARTTAVLAPLVAAAVGIRFPGRFR